MTHARAAELIRMGFRVLPLLPGTKIPRQKEWQKGQATLDDFRPGDGVGILLGWQPNRLHLTVPDFDHRPNDGALALVELQRFIDAAPASLMQRKALSRSMSGKGYHLWLFGKQTIRKHPMKN